MSTARQKAEHHERPNTPNKKRTRERSQFVFRIAVAVAVVIVVAYMMRA